MKYTIHYKTFPNCPEATEYSKMSELTFFYLGIFLNLGMVSAIVGCFVLVHDYLKTYDYNLLIAAILFASFGSAVCFWCYIWRPRGVDKNIRIILIESKSMYTDEEKKAICKRIRKDYREEILFQAKSYFLIFFIILSLFISLVVVIGCIYRICHGQNCFVSFIVSICVFVLFCSIAAILYIKLLVKSYTCENDCSVSKMAYICSKFVDVWNVISIVVCALLLFKMIPFSGGIRILMYVSVMVLVVAITLILSRIKNKYKHMIWRLVSLVFSLILIVYPISTRIIYECKYDYVVENIPQNGKIDLKIKTEEKFYATNGNDFCDQYSYLEIDGVKYFDDDVFTIELNKPYYVIVGAGDYDYNFDISVGKWVTFNSQTLREFVIQEKVSSRLYEPYAKVTMRFEQVCDFWYVVNY